MSGGVLMQQERTLAGGRNTPCGAELQAMAMEVCGDLERANVIYRRRNRIVVRKAIEGGTVILKMWSRPGWRGVIRWLTRSGSCDHEYANLLRLHRAGARVPEPLGMCRLPLNPAGFTDALFLEDLGECHRATEHLKSLVGEGRHAEVLAFEEELIELTAGIIRAGLIDTDHGLINTVVAGGRAVRLDVEMARRCPIRGLWRGRYGRMLGHLLATHAFAVQPEVRWTEAFARRLAARLSPPRGVLRAAGRYVQRMMESQKRRDGIDTRVEVGW